MSSEDHQALLNVLNQVLDQNYANLNEAEIAFERKYANEYYKISEHEENGISQNDHQTILKKYGQKLTAISIESFELIDEEDDDFSWLIKSLINDCSALKKIQLAHLSVDLAKLLPNFKQLTHCSFTYLDINGDDWTSVELLNLKHLIFKVDIRLEFDHFAKFVESNCQIESLELSTHFNPLQAISGKLNKLKELKLDGGNVLDVDQLDTVTLNSLESLYINCINIIPVLKVFRNGCNNINKLHVILTALAFDEIIVDLNDVTAEICLYKQITVLTIENIKFTPNQIEQFGKHLQHLASLAVEMKTDNEFTCQILHLVPIFTTLVDCSIKLDVEMLSGINYDFHQRFLAATVKNRADFRLSLISQNNDELILSKETIYQMKSGFKPILLHWIGYEAASSISKVNILELEDKCINRLFDHMDLSSLNILKQTCHTLQTKVIEYVRETFQTRTFICHADDNIHELRKVFQSFGQYFQKIKIQIPGLCEKTEIFQLINRFCKNVVEMSITNQSFTNGLIHPVQFELPHLQQLFYRNDTGIDLEISAFVGCTQLQCLELRSSLTGSWDDQLNLLQEKSSFPNLKAIKLYTILSSALNLLANLNANVKSQLRELWITTPIYYEDNESRLVKIVKQFRGLTNLHLILPNKYFNSQDLFSFCQNITELSILTEATDKSVEMMLQQIQKHCTRLEILHIYRYDDVTPVDVLKLALNLFPNATIKSTLMDPYGTVEGEDIVTVDWLQLKA